MVNNIRNNTISEISAKKGLNALHETKNTEIKKYKRHSPGQKEWLNLFNDLSDTILTDKTLKSKSQKDNTLMSSKDENDNENVNENENGNDKTLMSTKDENKNAKNKKKTVPIPKKQQIKKRWD